VQLLAHDSPAPLRRGVTEPDRYCEV